MRITIPNHPPGVNAHRAALTGSSDAIGAAAAGGAAPRWFVCACLGVPEAYADGGAIMKLMTNGPGWRRIAIRLIGASVFMAAHRSASSLTIVRDFIGGSPGTMDSGSGDIVGIFNAAADIWELAIRDEHVLTLHYGWAPVGGGEHRLNAQGGVPNRETEGTILFNNDSVPGHYHYYLDPTPGQSEEFGSYSEADVQLGGGALNATRVFRSGPELFDLLTTALHEIGHALGMSLANTSFIGESADGDVDVVAPTPHAGTAIPLQTNLLGVTSHIGYVADRVLMSGSFAPAERVMPSALDIVALAQLSGFRRVNLALAPLLDIRPSGTSVSVAWQQPIGDYGLQGSDDLSRTDRWSAVSLPVSVTNGTRHVSIPVTASGRFFRVRQRRAGLRRQPLPPHAR